MGRIANYSQAGRSTTWHGYPVALDDTATPDTSFSQPIYLLSPFLDGRMDREGEMPQVRPMGLDGL